MDIVLNFQEKTAQFWMHFLVLKKSNIVYVLAKNILVMELPLENYLLFKMLSEQTDQFCFSHVASLARFLQAETMSNLHELCSAVYSHT